MVNIRGDVVLITGKVIVYCNSASYIQKQIAKTKLYFYYVVRIGGSGFLGQHIIKHLQEKDDDVKEIRVVDLKPYANKLSM